VPTNKITKNTTNFPINLHNDERAVLEEIGGTNLGGFIKECYLAEIERRNKDAAARIRAARQRQYEESKSNKRNAAKLRGGVLILDHSGSMEKRTEVSNSAVKPAASIAVIVEDLDALASKHAQSPATGGTISKGGGLYSRKKRRGRA